MNHFVRMTAKNQKLRHYYQCIGALKCWLSAHLPVYEQMFLLASSAACEVLIEPPTLMTKHDSAGTMQSSVSRLILLALNLSCEKASSCVEARRLQVASGPRLCCHDNMPHLKDTHYLITPQADSSEDCSGGLCSVLPTESVMQCLDQSVTDQYSAGSRIYLLS